MHASQLLYDRTPGSSGNFNLMSPLTGNQLCGITRNTTNSISLTRSSSPSH